MTRVIERDVVAVRILSGSRFVRVISSVRGMDGASGTRRLLTIRPPAVADIAIHSMDDDRSGRVRALSLDDAIASDRAFPAPLAR